MREKDFASAFERLDQEHGFSGTILVARDGDVGFENAYGFASRQLDVPNRLDTKFHIASLTKMFTAMATLVLVEQGRIELQERPAAYVPELAALDREITLHHLLSHTSGLQDIYDLPNLRFEMSRLEHENGNLLDYLAQLPQTFRPGAGWGYSTTGYILIGYLLKRVTGLAFADMMQRLVLAPLSLTSTGVDHPRRINPGRAAGHALEAGALVNAGNDELSLFEDAPGELYSTARDLKTWGDAMFACPLVSPQTLRLMFTPHARVDPTLQYGYGWFLAPRYRMHGGGTPGFVSRIRQYPEQKVSIILLFNSTHMDPDAVLSEIDPLVLG